MHHESRTKDLRPAALKPRPQRMTAEPELAVADAGRADPENRILLLLPLDSPTRLQPAQPLLPRRDACVRKAPKGRVWQRDVREGVPCRVREDQGRTPIFGRGCRADLIRALWLRAAGMPIGGFVAKSPVAAGRWDANRWVCRDCQAISRTRLSDKRESETVVMDKTWPLVHARVSAPIE